ncbi:MAG: hypothetical protein ACREAS_01190 [Nitrososphaera sp.]
MAFDVSADARVPETSFSDICRILSDNDSFKMLQMIFERRQLSINDFGSRKRYYDRMTKLRKSHLITKKKNNGHETKFGTGQELTDLGSAIYESLLFFKRAEKLYWNLKAIDMLDDEVPVKDHNKLVEELIPDEAIRKILLERI